VLGGIGSLSTFASNRTMLYNSMVVDAGAAFRRLVCVCSHQDQSVLPNMHLSRTGHPDPQLPLLILDSGYSPWEPYWWYFSDIPFVFNFFPVTGENEIGVSIEVLTMPDAADSALLTCTTLHCPSLYCNAVYLPSQTVTKCRPIAHMHGPWLRHLSFNFEVRNLSRNVRCRILIVSHTSRLALWLVQHLPIPSIASYLPTYPCSAAWVGLSTLLRTSCLASSLAGLQLGACTIVCVEGGVLR
jgi:hypothetical protein